MRTNRSYFFRACYDKEVGHHHLGLAETQMQSSKSGRLYNEKKKKKEGFVYTLIEGFWQEEARGKLTISESFYVVGLVSTVDCH